MGISFLHSVQKLVMRECTGVTGHGFKYLKKLRVLDIQGCISIVYLAINHLKALTTLIMRYCDGNTITTKRFKRLKNLERLDITLCPQPSDFYLSLHNFKKLKHLQGYRCIKSKGLHKGLPFLKTLVTLEVNVYDEYTRIDNILKYTPLLEGLAVTCRNSFTFRGNGLVHTPLLKRLSISNFRGLPFATYQDMCRLQILEIDILSEVVLDKNIFKGLRGSHHITLTLPLATLTREILTPLDTLIV